MLTSPKVWAQLGMSARIETVTHEFVTPVAFVQILLSLAPRHGFDDQADHQIQSAVFSKVQPPIGIPRVTLDRIKLAMKLSSHQPMVSTPSAEEDMLYFHLYDPPRHIHVTYATDQVVQDSAHSGNASSQSYSACFSQTSGLSSQSSMNKPSFTSEASSVCAEHYKMSREEVVIEDLAKLIDAPFRYLLFGHKVSSWSGVVEGLHTDYPSLSQLSPATFCPGYQEVIYLCQSE